MVTNAEGRGGGVRVVDFESLPRGMEPQVHLLDVSAGWQPLDFGASREAAEAGYPSAPYYGVYALEGGKVLSAVRVLRVPYTFASGEAGAVSMIQGVVTRKGFGRRGLARRLLREAHRREKRAGNRYSLLWTGAGNFAHRLYESLGYSDLYSSSMALKRCPRGARPAGYKTRAIGEGDFATVEKLHSESALGRVGFTPRPKGLLQGLLKIGILSLGSLRLVLLRGEPVAYAHVHRGEGWTKSEEVVLGRGAEPEDVERVLEMEAHPGWLVVQGTYARDRRTELMARGYALRDVQYYGLMGKRFSGGRDPGRELGTDDPRFTCHYLDYFYC